MLLNCVLPVVLRAERPDRFVAMRTDGKRLSGNTLGGWKQGPPTLDGHDVFDAEPKIPDALKAMENVVLAPHVGSASVETRQAMGDLVCDNLFKYFDDGTVLTPVPESKGLV